RVGGGPFEFNEEVAIKKALQKRLDLQVLYSRVVDSQRKIIIAQDKLDPKLNLVGSYRTGGSRSGSGAFSDDIGLDFRKGIMTAGLDAELPWDKNSEMHAFRQSYLNLQVSLREYQKLEDGIKLQIRDRLRSLIQNRQSFINQSNALALAKRRVDSTNLFLQAGRVAIRDLLDAQDDLIEAQDSLTSAIVSYRLSELALQRDMGTLQVSDNGIVREINE
ncbi:MAG: TolC family protein, partial [Lentisphaeraceae bacterium]|nr:TolC family protein [Lentisphaeraceae bacterium]